MDFNNSSNETLYLEVLDNNYNNTIENDNDKIKYSTENEYNYTSNYGIINRNENFTNLESFSITPEKENQKLLHDISDIHENILRNSKEHKYWIDALRVFASYMVVTIHASSYAIHDISVLSGKWKKLMFWDALNRPAVPLFLMISGILFLDPHKNIPISKIYKKYIPRILKIIIFWNIFYGTICKYLIDGYEFKRKSFWKDIFYDFICGKFHMWYLYMCIGLYIETPIVRTISKDIEILKYFVIIALIFCQVLPFIVTFFNVFYPNDYIKFSNEAVGSLMVYLVSGFIIYYPLGYLLYITNIKYNFILILVYITGILTLITTYILKIIGSEKNNKEIADFGDYNALNISIAAICIFIFFKYTGAKLLKLSLHIKNFKIILLTLSDLSLGIYLIHVCFLEFFFYKEFCSYTYNPTFFTPVYSLFIWACSAITVYFFKKIPFIREFV